MQAHRKGRQGKSRSREIIGKGLKDEVHLIATPDSWIHDVGVRHVRFLTKCVAFLLWDFAYFLEVGQLALGKPQTTLA